MGEAKRRKIAGNALPKGKAWRVFKPSRFVKVVVPGKVWNPLWK